ncbi:unnamed protein product [Rotaria magnacalcarata]|uniref:Centrosomal protein of 70 kDa n=4 Tax=Rotaria magnacalcarata TaxID=392030 RepID=A0A815AI44_9BILA|nr:unnamed protein product [Rotaria magnacalcarata]CAF1938435.1 unnamed protein product [Rotaria magnacalcarata]CAF1975533.1 unnamed protein product [Rotaria magnacalcarata]CAF3837940.1 unnamed protein product [Rotaria magnacalcarata]CAF3871725.1 unnamed protein product [Rotaria magnacalcarata]
MSSSTASKRVISNAFRYPQSNNRHDIFLNNSSSSSITEDEGGVKTYDDSMPNNELGEPDKRKNTLTNGHHSSMNNQNSKKDIGAPMIQELIQSNMDLKKEIREIRRQIKNNNGASKQRIDRAMIKASSSNKMNTLDDDACSFVPPEHGYYDDQSTTISKLQQYKTEATVYKQQFDACQETIAQLRKTIDSMEKRIEQVRTIERRQVTNASDPNENYSTNTNNNTDHRFIHELFHLCIKHAPRSSKSKTTIPSHQDMKTFIRQTFHDFITTPTPTTKIGANKNHEIGHFICKCSDRIHAEHRPTYQYCLTMIEQCQSLFDVTCFTQLPTALNELYYRHGELTNFKRSIASTLGVTENSRLVSCPKLIKTLQQTLDDTKSNELVTFKKLAKINDMNEAVSKIRSYDDFVPYYHQFIEQMASLLEVSKGDEIMPAIKTLKLLAHGESDRPDSSSQRSYSLMRASSLNSHKIPLEKNLTHSKSLRILSSRSDIDESNAKQLQSFQNQNEESEQHVGTDDGDS